MKTSIFVSHKSCLKLTIEHSVYLNVLLAKKINNIPYSQCYNATSTLSIVSKLSSCTLIILFGSEFCSSVPSLGSDFWSTASQAWIFKPGSLNLSEFQIWPFATPDQYWMTTLELHHDSDHILLNWFLFTRCFEQLIHF